MNNEEKIISMLEKHSEMLEKQGAMLEKHSELLAELKADQLAMKADQATMRADLTAMKATQDEMRGDISEMQATLTRVAVTQEGVVLPRLQTLYETHESIIAAMDNLVPVWRIEKVERELDVVKEVLKTTVQDAAGLKRAQ